MRANEESKTIIGCLIPWRSAKCAIIGSKNTLINVETPIIIPIFSGVSPLDTSQTGKNGRVMPTIAK